MAGSCYLLRFGLLFIRFGGCWVSAHRVIGIEFGVRLRAAQTVNTQAPCSGG
jgi:hypothetical protein